MSYTLFKTPRSIGNDESTTSDGSGSSVGSNCDISIVAFYDDLIKTMKHRMRNMDDVSAHYIYQCKELFEKYCELTSMHNKLQAKLERKEEELIEAEKRVTAARLIIDDEKRKRQICEREKECLEHQLDQVREVFLKDKQVKLAEDSKEKLSFLQQRYSSDGADQIKLSRVQEVNTTGSMLSDFSVSRSEDDLDVSRFMSSGRKWKKHKATTAGELDPAQKRKRTSTKRIEIAPTDTLRATTTLTLNKNGPLKATSIIESVPNTDDIVLEKPLSSDDGIGSITPSAAQTNLVFESWSKTETPKRRSVRHELRLHCFQQKTVVIPDSCNCCDRRLKFGKSALKCKECRSTCHFECKDFLPLPCVPAATTPNHKPINMGVISDYTPTIPPMVPALIIHCTNEIELRGFNELGLYRISASEREVKMLKEKFLKGKGPPAISQTDIHVLCGCVKDFLRSLAEPLVTYGLWHDFVKAAECKDAQDIAPAIFQCISELPQPNRDTLAYVMLHLQKVAQARECKMPIENLAKVFGPTIVGFSSENPDTEDLLTETGQQIKVVDLLLRLPSDYWTVFINVTCKQSSSRLQQTPSTDSLLRPHSRFFTPTGSRMKKRKYFDTPPNLKY